MKPSTNSSVIVGVASSVIGAGIGFIFTPLYIQYLGAESFGLIGFVLGLQVWLSIFDFGLGATATRSFARERSQSSQRISVLWTSVQCIYFWISATFCTGVTIAAPYIASNWLRLETISHDTATFAIRLLGISIAMQWMGSIYRSAIIGLGKQSLLGLVTIISGAFRVLATLAALAKYEPSLSTFAVCQVVGYGLEMAYLRLAVTQQLPIRKGHFKFEALRKVANFALGLTGINILATALNHIDKLILSGILPMKDFGNLALAMLAVSTISLLVAPVYNSAYPAFSKAHASNDLQLLAEHYHVDAQWMAWLISPLAATLFFLAPAVLYAWTGDHTLSAQTSPIVSAWVLGTVINGINHVPYAVQLAYGWTRLALCMNGIAVALMIPALWWIVPRFGAVGAGWIWCTTNLGFLIVGGIKMHRQVLSREGISWIYSDTLVPLFLCGLIAYSASLLMTMLGISSRVELLILIALTMSISFFVAGASISHGRRALVLGARRLLILGRKN